MWSAVSVRMGLTAAATVAAGRDSTAVVVVGKGLAEATATAVAVALVVGMDFTIGVASTAKSAGSSPAEASVANATAKHCTLDRIDSCSLDCKYSVWERSSASAA